MDKRRWSIGTILFYLYGYDENILDNLKGVDSYSGLVEKIKRKPNYFPWYKFQGSDLHKFVPNFGKKLLYVKICSEKQNNLCRFHEDKTAGYIWV